MRDFQIRAFARGDRHQAIEAAKEAVLRRRGDILDFTPFSNLALSMVLELRGDGVVALVDALAALEWTVELRPSREALSGRAGEVLGGTLHLTFPEGDGELRIRVPDVPG